MHIFSLLAKPLNNSIDLFDSQFLMSSHAAQISPLSQWLLETVLPQKIFMPWSEVMALALYHPDWGYYQQNKIIFGQSGDFITAPDMDSSLANAIAHACLQCNQTLSDPLDYICEWGAGEGTLAQQLLSQPLLNLTGYDLIDCCQSRLTQQRSRLTNNQQARFLIHPDKKLPRQIIIAHEFFDAFPAELIARDNDGAYWQIGITRTDLHLAWAKRPLPNHLMKHALRPELPIPDSGFYQTEWAPDCSNWLIEQASDLQQGFVLIFDYGYEESIFNHPQRHMGTLVAIEKHRWAEPLLHRLGYQDLTAHVRFSDLAHTATKLGWDVLAYGSMEDFILTHQVNPSSTKLIAQLAQQMGTMKVMLLGINLSQKTQEALWLSRNQRDRL